MNPSTRLEHEPANAFAFDDAVDGFRRARAGSARAIWW
jgi:hypothetical protein